MGSSQMPDWLVKIGCDQPLLEQIIVRSSERLFRFLRFNELGRVTN